MQIILYFIHRVKKIGVMMLLSATYTGHVLKFVIKNIHALGKYV